MRKLGLFSSPTGTGKSLSLICSVMSYYLNPDIESAHQGGSINSETIDEWERLFANTGTSEPQKSKLKMKPHKRRYGELDHENLKQIKSNLAQKRLKRKREEQQNGEESLIIQYDSDEDQKLKKLKAISMKAENLKHGKKYFDHDKINQKEKQVIFCTRTHSQISQLINEIKKVKKFEDLVVAPLISRKGLCVNDKFKNVENVTVLNEKCQDLCEKTGGCPHRDPDHLELITGNLAEEHHDIEELQKRCQRTKICGYYAARTLAEEADVIVTPYQSILSEATRSALGLGDLSGRILVFDEAHNLMDIITSINSIELHSCQIDVALKSLKAYLDKYQKRMAPKNVKTIRDLIRILTQFEKYFEGIPKETVEKAVEVIDVLTETDLYSFDFEKLHSFFDKADLVKKLNGFMQQNANKSDQILPFSRSILYQIKEFIRILSLNPSDGKLVIKRNQGASL